MGTKHLPHASFEHINRRNAPGYDASPHGAPDASHAHRAVADLREQLDVERRERVYVQGSVQQETPDTLTIAHSSDRRYLMGTVAVDPMLRAVDEAKKGNFSR